MNWRTWALWEFQQMLFYLKQKSKKAKMKSLYIETFHLLLQVIFFPLVSSHPINFLENFIFFSTLCLKFRKPAISHGFFLLLVTYWIYRVDYKLFSKAVILKLLFQQQSYLTGKVYLCVIILNFFSVFLVLFITQKTRRGEERSFFFLVFLIIYSTK